MAIKKGFARAAILRRRAIDEGKRTGVMEKIAMPQTGDTHDSLTMCAQMWCDSLIARGFAPATLDLRRRSLRWFIEWAIERDVRRVGEVTRPVLEAYQRRIGQTEPEHGHGKRLSWGAQRARMHTLKAWFRWLTRRDVLMHNPASEIELPRQEKRLPATALTLEEVARLLAVHDLADPLGVRDRAICEVFYSTGIRRAELAHLGLTDVNTGRGTLDVRQGKGGKDRVVPLGARAAAWVARYLADVRPRLSLDAREQALFLTGYGEAFKPDTLTGMMSAWMRAVGLAGRGSCHLLRHTCATHMLEGGADVRYIQQLLGHENLETTAIYTEVTIKKLLEVHARCHPSENPDAVQNPASHAPPNPAALPAC